MSLRMFVSGLLLVVVLALWALDSVLDTAGELAAQAAQQRDDVACAIGDGVGAQRREAGQVGSCAGHGQVATVGK